MPDLPASKRLRIGRYNESNRIYLLTSNTLDREPIFQDFKLGRLVVQQFRIAQNQGLATSLAWVVMPDHFHWLISLEKGSLCDLMRQVKSKSTRIINGVAGRQGRLWQPGFHDHAVRREGHSSLHCGQPIESRPGEEVWRLPLMGCDLALTVDRVAAIAGKPAPTGLVVCTPTNVGAGLPAIAIYLSPKARQTPLHPPTTPPPQSP